MHHVIHCFMSFIVLKIRASWGWEQSETPRVYPDTPDIGPDSPGVVSGYSCRVHNAPTLEMQNFFKTMNDMMHDRPTLPSYAETPNRKIT